jgi:MFS family permease
MIIYFRDLGFSFLQISVILAAFGIGMFLFEAPTGAFADITGRKYSVIIGFLLTGAAVSLMPLFTNFYALLSLWVFAGIGMTFVSGAEEAWIIDNLNHMERKDLHHEYFIKSSSLGAFGAIFAPMLGAVIVKSHPISTLWYVFGFGFLASAIILSIFAKELYKPEKTRFIQIMKKTLTQTKAGLKFTLTHKVIFLLTLGGIFSYLMIIGDNGWQPFLVSLSMPTYYLGVMYSIGAAIMMITPFLSKLFVKMQVKKVIALITLIRMVLLLSVLFIYPPFYLIAAIICIMDDGLRTLKDPLLQTYFHKFVPENIRATVVSVGSMITRITIALASVIAGALIDIFGPQKVLALGGLFGVFAIAIYLKIKD